VTDLFIDFVTIWSDYISLTAPSPKPQSHCHSHQAVQLYIDASISRTCVCVCVCVCVRARQLHERHALCSHCVASFVVNRFCNDHRRRIKETRVQKNLRRRGQNYCCVVTEVGTREGCRRVMSLGFSGWQIAIPTKLRTYTYGWVVAHAHHAPLCHVCLCIILTWTKVSSTDNEQPNLFLARWPYVRHAIQYVSTCKPVTFYHVKVALGRRMFCYLIIMLCAVSITNIWPTVNLRQRVSGLLLSKLLSVHAVI